LQIPTTIPSVRISNELEEGEREEKKMPFIGASYVSPLRLDQNYVYCVAKEYTKLTDILNTCDKWLICGSDVVDIWPRCGHHVTDIGLVCGSNWIYGFGLHVIAIWFIPAHAVESPLNISPGVGPHFILGVWYHHIFVT
jgi:hypothetical protein